jgi:TonB family protein
VAAVVLAFSAIGRAEEFFPSVLESFEYPPLAIQARITGTVELRLRIDQDGAVVGVERVSGHALLAGAAEKGLRAWKFSARDASRESANGKVVLLKVRFALEGMADQRPRTRMRYVYPDGLLITGEHMHWQPSAGADRGNDGTKQW